MPYATEDPSNSPTGKSGKDRTAPPSTGKKALITIASDFGTPVSVFHNLSRDEKNAFLFESTEGDSRLARFSFLGVDPLMTISCKQGRATTTYNDGRTTTEPVGNPIALLKSELDKFTQAIKKESTPGNSTQEAEDQSVGQAISRLELPFTGGLVGFMGYGAVAALENIPLQKNDPLNVPDCHYGLYDSVVVFDHQYRRVTFLSHRGREHAEQLIRKALQSAALPPLELSSQGLSDAEIFANVGGPFTEESFKQRVLAAKEFIREGQAFQIVLAQRFERPTQAKSSDIYRALQATNPSPYAYFLKGPDFTYLGSSPETFVRCQNNKVMLRAIAGTRKRGATQELDDQLAVELRENEKEMAEHRMLVDLGRNDLGRVCKVGSIEVGELARLTKYTHVMHLATEINGELEADKTCFDAFASCFPAGTVSGAPKVRAMQLLSELEPEQRGVYAGAIGYFDLKGNMDGAIAIRSALIKDGTAHITAGGGNVYDSDPQMEYEETRNKAKSVLQAIRMAEGKC